MSHYKVLVIGEDVEGLLDPFNENLEVDPYLDEDFDDQAELQAAREHRAAHGDPSAEASDVEVLEAWAGGTFRANATGALERWTTWNPKGMWDWWTVGGRWPDALLLKPEAGAKWANTARAEQIDFEAMAQQARTAAEEEFARMLAAPEGLPIPDGDFDAFVKRAGGDLPAAREAWRSHPWVKATTGLGY